MSFFYQFIVFITSLLLPLLAVFNKKLRLFVTGRKETFQALSVLSSDDKTIWIHAASLGEFEQARPIIEALKKTHANYKVVVTFFSPSGYEIRNNYHLAAVVCYLPLDSKKKVSKFLQQASRSWKRRSRTVVRRTSGHSMTSSIGSSTTSIRIDCRACDAGPTRTV